MSELIQRKKEYTPTKIKRNAIKLDGIKFPLPNLLTHQTKNERDAKIKTPSLQTLDST